MMMVHGSLVIHDISVQYKITKVIYFHIRILGIQNLEYQPSIMDLYSDPFILKSYEYITSLHSILCYKCKFYLLEFH